MKILYGIYSNELKGFLNVDSYQYCFLTRNDRPFLEYTTKECAEHAINQFTKIYLKWFVDAHKLEVRKIN